MGGAEQVTAIRDRWDLLSLTTVKHPAREEAQRALQVVEPGFGGNEVIAEVNLGGVASRQIPWEGMGLKEWR